MLISFLILATLDEYLANNGSLNIFLVVVNAVSISGAPVQTKCENSAFFPLIGKPTPYELVIPVFSAQLIENSANSFTYVAGSETSIWYIKNTWSGVQSFWNQTGVFKAWLTGSIYLFNFSPKTWATKELFQEELKLANAASLWKQNWTEWVAPLVPLNW